jgi:hypothetical protein
MKTTVQACDADAQTPLRPRCITHQKNLNLLKSAVRQGVRHRKPKPISWVSITSPGSNPTCATKMSVKNYDSVHYQSIIDAMRSSHHKTHPGGNLKPMPGCVTSRCVSENLNFLISEMHQHYRPVRYVGSLMKCSQACSTKRKKRAQIYYNMAILPITHSHEEHLPPKVLTLKKRLCKASGMLFFGSSDSDVGMWYTACRHIRLPTNGMQFPVLVHV